MLKLILYNLKQTHEICLLNETLLCDMLVTSISGWKYHKHIQHTDSPTRFRQASLTFLLSCILHLISLSLMAMFIPENPAPIMQTLNKICGWYWQRFVTRVVLVHEPYVDGEKDKVGKKRMWYSKDKMVVLNPKVQQQKCLQ